MHMGSPRWLKRERDDLVELIEHYVVSVNASSNEEWQYMEQKWVNYYRGKLRLLRENPREYVRQAEEKLS